MKKSIYIILALIGILGMNSCSDDEYLAGNPDMEFIAGKVSALYGDSLPFTIKASDVEVPLSTLKAKLFMAKNKCPKRLSVQRQAAVIIPERSSFHIIPMLSTVERL